MEKKVKRAVIKYYIATAKHRTATFYNWVNEFKHGRTFIEMNVVWGYQWLNLQEKQMSLRATFYNQCYGGGYRQNR